jgi:hypothetical protein
MGLSPRGENERYGVFDLGLIDPVSETGDGGTESEDVEWFGEAL